MSEVITYCLEVVFLGLPADEQVEGPIDVLRATLLGLAHICLILVWIQQYAQGSFVISVVQKKEKKRRNF